MLRFRCLLGIAARQFAHQALHPCRQHAKAIEQILADRGAMCRVGQDLAEFAEDGGPVRRQGIFQPVQRLHHAHGRTPGPVQPAGRRLLEFNGHVVELNCAAARVGMDGGAGRYRIGQAKIVGGRHAIDQQAQLVPACNRLGHRAVVRRGVLCRRPRAKLFAP